MGISRWWIGGRNCCLWLLISHFLSLCFDGFNIGTMERYAWSIMQENLISYITKMKEHDTNLASHIQIYSNI